MVIFGQVQFIEPFKYEFKPIQVLMKIKKAVITAAARNERLYPVATTVQKAMLPTVDLDGINKPIIQIIAEEALQSGIEEICIVCAPGDEERYLDSFQSLYTTSLKIRSQSKWAETQAINIKNVLRSFKLCCSG